MILRCKKVKPDGGGIDGCGSQSTYAADFGRLCGVCGVGVMRPLPVEQAGPELPQRLSTSNQELRDLVALWRAEQNRLTADGDHECMIAADAICLCASQLEDRIGK